jgi:hypothetical protein
MGTDEYRGGMVRDRTGRALSFQARASQTYAALSNVRASLAD